MKTLIANYLKNLLGWNIKRKIVIFSVDDYGNVRVNSKRAHEKMIKAGLKPINHFDIYDTLETNDDLSALFDVLTSVKDCNNQNAKFTPFAVPCNINFEEITENNYKEYKYELLPETFSKLSNFQPNSYKGTWDLWLEGIRLGIFCPQFHGREHLNLKVFNEFLNQKNYLFLTALRNRSYASIPSTKYSSISYTAAFDFQHISELDSFEEIISDGVKRFNEIFGYYPIHFNAPGATASKFINPFLVNSGIKFSDNPILQKEHLGDLNYTYNINYTGKKIIDKLYNLNRNVVFEPCENKGYNAVNFALNQIEAAFFMKKPAIISSHRVNFCGHISESNRKNGLKSLQDLLISIIKKWPDVEFLTSGELCKYLIEEKIN